MKYHGAANYSVGPDNSMAGAYGLSLASLASTPGIGAPAPVAKPTFGGPAPV